jgi:peptidoglycan/xylan/chitin deacetylase (PgdA/CDA1 family)
MLTAAGFIAALALAVPVAGWLVTRDPGPVAPQEQPADVDAALVERTATRSPAPGERVPTIPVLTYHGLADSGSRYRVQPERFAEQIAALDAAGYRTVSADQFRRFVAGERVQLPRNPILITFDIGPKSVWTIADPVLRRHGFRATVMTTTGKMGANQPYYLTWEEAERLHGTGRWDFASQTRDGHRLIATDPRGGRGAFLTHRRWLDAARRLETLEEYRARVRSDLAASVKDLSERGLGRAAVFAFPFSTSELPTNDPRIPAILEREVFGRFEAVLDNTTRPARLPANAGRRYLPRFEIFRTTTTSALLSGLAEAPQLPRQLPPPGKEAIYPFLDRGSREDADLLLRGRWRLDRYEPVTIRTPTWTEDPYDEQYWRFNYYGLRPLLDLLYAYRSSGDDRYLRKLEELLRSFVAADDARVDRRRTGLNRKTWDYKYGAAFRALTLVNIRAKLARTDDLDPEIDRGIRRSVRRLGSFLAEQRNFDVDNNHGFAEASALLLIAETFRALPEARRWRSISDRRLVRLIADNVDAGGVQVERSPFYHLYVLRLASDLTVWARRHDVALPAAFVRRADSMLRFAAWITQPDGFIPLQGSSVKTNVRKLAPETFAAIGERFPEFEWARTGGLSGRPERARAAAFRPSGDAILRSDWGTPLDATKPSMIAFNGGPYRTTHAQHDALAFTFFAAERPLLVDAGLYTYDRNRWFRHFTSTRAHNTVTIDGRDQRRGPVTLGLVTEGPGWSYASGAHRLYPGATVRRSVVLLGRELALVVDDVAAGRRARIRQHWNLFPGASLKRRGERDVYATSNGRPLLALWQDDAQQTTLRDHFGDTSPIGGWFSELYGRKRPSHAIEYGVSARSARLATLIAAGSQAGANDGRVRLAEVRPGTLRAQACLGRAKWTIDIAGQASARERVSVRLGARC